MPSVMRGAERSKGFSGRTQARRGRSASKMAKMKWQKEEGSVKRDQLASVASLGLQTTMGINGAKGIYGASRRPPRA